MASMTSLHTAHSAGGQDRLARIGHARQAVLYGEAGGSDAFVHMSAVEAAGMSTLEKEQRLSYELENDKRGKSSAVNLQTA